MEGGRFYSASAVNVPREDYKEEFDPSCYLKFFEANRSSDIPPYQQFKLRCFYEAFLAVPEGVSVLDYGAGPTIAFSISAATKASHIVFSDYTEPNRSFLRQWLSGDCKTFDWSPYFSYVVQELEGKGEKEARERQELVRKLSRAVVHCDITNDPPIERGYEQPYDVVMCTLVMEGASTNCDEYCANIAQLGKLVKPGGKVFYNGVENKVGYYTIGNKNFPNIHVDHEFSLSAFERAGFKNLTMTHAPIFDPNHLFWFIQGTKI